MTQEEERLLKTAELVARLAHKGQKDKAGCDYIAHPLAVASFLDTPEEKAVGLLHDVMEDTWVGEAELRPVFGDRITDALLLLIHGENEPYLDYVRRVKENPLARKVKLADLRHNMDLSRIPSPRQKDLDRIEKKYKPAVKILTEES